MERTFIDYTDSITDTYWMGIKYTVEVAFQGHVIAVFDSNDENVIDEREGYILQKWSLKTSQ